MHGTVDRSYMVGHVVLVFCDSSVVDWSTRVCAWFC